MDSKIAFDFTLVKQKDILSLALSYKKEVGRVRWPAPAL
jgi:hypothetical protein